MGIEFYKSSEIFYNWGLTKIPGAIVIELGNYTVDITWE